MKILIITQSVDKKNQVLGFFHRWIEEFAKKFEYVTVICLEKGEYDLPKNVSVFSLGKEYCKSRVRYIINFYRYIIGERKNYDLVFVHMNPIYVIMGFIVWNIFNKKIGLWYVHKSVDTKLKIASLFVDKIFTASKDSFRLETDKVNIVGHGIDTDLFKTYDHIFNHRIITIGRISKAKNIIRIIKVFNSVYKINNKYTLTIIGDAVTDSDRIYKNEVINLINSLGLGEVIILLGTKGQNELPEILSKYDMFVNLSDTGSVDKAVLEAAASGVQIITNNIAFKDIFPDSYVSGDDNELIHKILSSDNFNYSQVNRELVIKNYNLSELITKVKHLYE